MESTKNTPAYKKILPKEFDPRSPTMEFDRTPIAINVSGSSSSISTVGNESFKSVLEGSYESFDINYSREDPSPVVSHCSMDSESSYSMEDNVDIEEINMDNTSSNSETSMDIELQESHIQSDLKSESKPSVSPFVTASSVVNNLSSVSEASKKIIFSPSMAMSSPRKSVNSSFTFHMDEEQVVLDTENSPQKTVSSATKIRSPRTPLAPLNKQSNSPLNILRAKQWKDFQEEREKLGIHHNGENILPPFKSASSSVPAKIPVRRRQV